MYPTLRQVVLDATDIRPLAEFYRELFGLTYRPGDEEPAGQDWLVLRNPSGRASVLRFRRLIVGWSAASERCVLTQFGNSVNS